MPRLHRYLIREVETNDLDELYRLAQHLNSVNFPHDKLSLEKMIEASQRSFAGRMDPPFEACYMFVLSPEDDPFRLAGTSTIVAQHGTPSAPHVYFDVLEDERYSTTLDRHFRHTTLRLGFSYQGPTEIGALVLDPELRSGGLGKPLSFVRFVFMAMYRERFRDEVIAELMPPLEADGRSRLWEHIGRRFTDLDYQEADKLSQANKEFIISLFPMQMNATLLPEDVRALIGEVGENTRGVRRMLESIGFEYVQRIDPFDGGPHFHAKTDDITIIHSTRPGRVDDEPLDDDLEQRVLTERESVGGAMRAIIAVGQTTGPTRFRATAAAIIDQHATVQLTTHTQRLLRIEPGDTVFITEI
ncbi:MAG: arginine N-succinyltransferase [Myxococcota bacterium]